MAILLDFRVSAFYNIFDMLRFLLNFGIEEHRCISNKKNIMVLENNFVVYSEMMLCQNYFSDSFGGINDT